MNYNLVPEITQEMFNKAIDVYHIVAFGKEVEGKYFVTGCYSSYTDFRNCNGTWNLGVCNEGLRIGVLGYPHTKIQVQFEPEGMGFFVDLNCGITDKPLLKRVKAECFKIMKAFVNNKIPLIVPNGSPYYSGFKEYLDKSK